MEAEPSLYAEKSTNLCDRQQSLDPLEKSLPNVKWMTNPIMNGTPFEPGKHKESGLGGSQGLLEHLKNVQRSCLYHRGLLLRCYVQGEECSMSSTEPVLKLKIIGHSPPTVVETLF